MRRSLRYSVRGLVTVVLVSSTLMAVWTSHARKQRLVCETVRTFGGAYTLDAQPFVPAPSWLVKAMGDEFFFSIQGVAIGSVEFTDADLGPLEVSVELRTLRLSDTHVTDAGLARLGKLQHLTTLELKRTDITDEGLKQLHALAKLQDLNLVDTDVTDKGLSNLPRFPELERLWIGKYDVQGVQEQPISDITDAGLLLIARQTNLKTLVLRNTRVTPRGIKKLQASLPGLKVQQGRASRPNTRGSRFIEKESRWVPEAAADIPNS